MTLLLGSGADVKAADEDGEVPLHLAAGQGHREIVTKLLNKGADVKVTNKSGSTPLHYAAANGHREVVASWRCC